MFAENKVQEAANSLIKKGVRSPAKGMILDAGMSGFSNELIRLLVIPFRQVAHYREPLHGSHREALLFGLLGNEEVMIQEGRAGLHEGFFHHEVSFPIRVLAALGVRKLILVSTARGIHTGWEAGEVMLVADHLDLTGGSPLTGLTSKDKKRPFLDISRAYTPELRERTQAIAGRVNFPLREGVLAAIPGPAHPTPAEARMLATVGADAVGMSLATEVAMAAYLGVAVAAFVLITGRAGNVAEERGANGWGPPYLAFFKTVLAEL